MINMARGKTHIVKHRRRRAGKTDYRLRLSMLKSGKPRLVIRKSSNNTTCQIIGYDPKGDKVMTSADSRSLKEYGWTGHCGNLPAAYLTGLLCGKQANKAGVKSAVADMGLYASVKGSRLYAAIKGVSDAGIQIPHSEDILPAKDRIEGKHTSNSDKSAKEFAATKEEINSGKAATKTEKTKTKPKSKKDSTSQKEKDTKPAADKTKRPI